MKEVLEESLQRVIEKLRPEFLGAQRLFLEGLVPRRLHRSTLSVTASVPPPSPSVLQRVADRVAELLLAELGTRVDVRIVAGRPRVDPARVEPLIDRGNRTAHLMFRAIAEGRGQGMNPAFVYGPPGTGKTYLLNGFLRSVAGPATVWGGHQFYEAVARLLRGQGLFEWRREQVESPLFVVDEVHRLAGKRRAQRELASLMDQLRARSAQVVLLGRHHPRSVQHMGHALTTRMLGGFTVEMQKPERETRRRYLRALGVDEGEHPELFERVAAGSFSYGEILGQVRALDGSGEPGGDRVRAILEQVAGRFGVSCDDLTRSDAGRRVSLPRQVAVFVARSAGIPGAEMARRFGWRSASSASYAVRRVEERMSEDPEFRRAVQALM